MAAPFRGHRDEDISEARDRWINCEETYRNQGQQRIESCEKMQRVVDDRWARPGAQARKRLAQKGQAVVQAIARGRVVGNGKVYQKDVNRRNALRAMANRVGIRRQRLLHARNAAQAAQAAAQQQQAAQQVRAAQARAARQAQAQRLRQAAAVRQQGQQRLAAARQRLAARRQQREAEAMADGFLGG